MYSAFEVDPSSLIARFNEGLRVMKTLWTESDVTFNGRFWQLEGANIDPKPFQKPYPPLWFGARQPAALRRAVRQGDGFFGAGSATTLVRHGRAHGAPGDGPAVHLRCAVVDPERPDLPAQPGQRHQVRDSDATAHLHGTISSS